MAIDIVPSSPGVSTVGTASSQFGAMHSLAFYEAGTRLAKVDRALDQMGAPSDTTTLDASSSKHGLMPKADKVKLDAIEAGATADQSDAEIETAYNSQVGKVSSGEISAGTETAVRRFSPADIVALIGAHESGSSTNAEEVLDAVATQLEVTDSITPTYNDAGNSLTFALNKKSSGLTSGSQGSLGSDSNGVFVNLGTSETTAASGADSRFPSSDEKAAMGAAATPTAGNPFITDSALIAKRLDQLAGCIDNTTNDATTSAHGLMSKNDKVKLDAIESGATADQSDAEIESAYNSRVTEVSTSEINNGTETQIRRWSPSKIKTAFDTYQADQVSSGERTAGTETELRSFSPADVKSMIDTHGDSAPDLILIAEQQTPGTNGGTPSGTGSWLTRTLNTVVQDVGGHASLSANKFQLPAGTYDIEARAPGYETLFQKIRLYNVTDATAVDDLVTPTGRVDNAANEMKDAVLSGRFTIAGTKEFRIEHWVTAAPTNGWGISSSIDSTPEQYTTVKLLKIA